MEACDSATGLRAQLVLEVSKAANRHLDLGEVLDALAESLAPKIRFYAIAVMAVEGEFLRLYSLSLQGMQRVPGESLGSFVARYDATRGYRVKDKLIPRSRIQDSCISELARTRRPYICSDLEQQKRFPEEEEFLRYGVLSYICLPLWHREQLVGAVHFTLHEKHEFSAYEVQLLEDIGDIVSIAVSNALAFERIKALQERLQEENLVLRDEIVQRSMYEEIVGSSAALRQVLAAIDKVAPTESTVLITGETGTGKELLARAIHRQSSRSGGPIVKVNCAALPAELIASELFGHERGAFTGALQQRIGRFETADGGTIFLDEIGELSNEMQVALLRVLQEGEYERVGSNVTRRTDVRVIAATNRNLAQEVADGRFRSDLYYRLNVFPIHSPALRERRDDIPILVDYFVARFSNRMGKRIEQIERSALQRLIDYSWPGNIRELQNIVERAVILTEGPVLRLEQETLPPVASTARSIAPPPGLPDAQREQIEQALRETRGRISGAKGAAARLGIPASTLESRIRSLGINKHQFRGS